ncbi:Endonuclease V [Phycisphaerae bacterium RAS1]|nr:Endonuclease V [Phycisphaerae bacterium RAS1]
MQFSRLHSWTTSPRAAIALQQRLRERVVMCELPADARLVAGVDVAFSRDGRRVIAGVVVWDRLTARAVQSVAASAPLRFPYVPGLLSFREIPAMLAAVRKLTTAPDVFICDGQGRAHPRRIGLASHFGLWLNRPTVGCAKSHLCGDYDEPPQRRGSRRALTIDGETVGAVLRTRDGTKPLFISPGHLSDIESSVELILALAPRYRQPEPTRLAHQLVTRAR